MTDATTALFIIPLIALSFCIMFPLLWVGIIFLVSRISGWHELAEPFVLTREPQGEKFRFKSGRIGLWANYSGALNITVSFEGIAIRPIIVYRLGHKAFLVPWDAVQTLTFEKPLFFEVITLMVRLPASGKEKRIQLYGSQVADSIKRHAPAQLLPIPQSEM